MSEIEKLYENANADKDCKLYANYGACPDKTKECTYCEYYVYPEFTAEKQLELIKWLAENKTIEISKHFIDLKNNRHHWVSRQGLQFEESLAELVNLIWPSLTDTEKAEIKEILK